MKLTLDKEGTATGRTRGWPRSPCRRVLIEESSNQRSSLTVACEVVNRKKGVQRAFSAATAAPLAGSRRTDSALLFIPGRGPGRGWSRTRGALGRAGELMMARRTGLHDDALAAGRNQPALVALWQSVQQTKRLAASAEANWMPSHSPSFRGALVDWRQLARRGQGETGQPVHVALVGMRIVGLVTPPSAAGCQAGRPPTSLGVSSRGALRQPPPRLAKRLPQT